MFNFKILMQLFFHQSNNYFTGSDRNFDMEQQLAENKTKVHFYGSNFDNAEIAIRFKKRLNGTQLHKDLKVGADKGKYN